MPIAWATAVKNKGDSVLPLHGFDRRQKLSIGSYRPQESPAVKRGTSVNRPTHELLTLELIGHAIIPVEGRFHGWYL